MSIQTIINQSSTQSLYSTRREDGCQGVGKGRAAKASAGRGQEIIRKTVAVKGDSIELSRDSSFRSGSWYEEDVSSYYEAKKPAAHVPGAKTAGCGLKEETAAVDTSGCVLPESYNMLKDYSSYYYHGENVSDYELVCLAVASGKMEIDEDIPAHLAALQAFRVMVEEEAQPKYGWSTTKYSEDGMYTFTKREDGSYDMHLIDDAGMGATLEEIAGWICSGIPNRNIETRYLDYLRRVDPDLYYAAQNIGREVRNYDMMTEAYKGGLIGDAQHDYDLGLLAMLFEKKGDEDFYRDFIAAKKTGDYSYFLENYSPEMAERLLDIRVEQMEKTGGIL